MLALPLALLAALVALARAVCTDTNCLDCGDNDTCVECKENYILDKRVATGGNPAAPADGKCILKTACTGVAGPDSTGKTCVYLGCAAIQGCTECGTGADVNKCAKCGVNQPNEQGTCEQAPPVPPCKVQNCETCVTDNENACQTCKTDFYLVAGEGWPSRTALRTCLSAEECDAQSGKVDGADCVYLDKEACKTEGSHCETCLGPEYTECATCASDALIDCREGEPAEGQPVTCLPEADCKDLAAPVTEEGKPGKCVALPCSAIEGCLKCDAADPEKCGACDKSFVLHEGLCRDDCLVGPAAVANCAECVKEGEEPEEPDKPDTPDTPATPENPENPDTPAPARREAGQPRDTRVCKACAKGYKLVEVPAEGEAAKEGEAAQTTLACQKAGLSAGAIAGIIIAVVVVVALVVGLCVYFLVCRKRKASAAVA